MYFSINQYILKDRYILVPIWERGLIDVSSDPIDRTSLQNRRNTYKQQPLGQSLRILVE
jgi:hypothetical protein